MNTQEQIIFNTANRLLAGTKTAAICIELADGKSAYLGDDAGVMRMLQNKDQSGAAASGKVDLQARLPASGPLTEVVTTIFRRARTSDTEACTFSASSVATPVAAVRGEAVAESEHTEQAQLVIDCMDAWAKTVDLPTYSELARAADAPSEPSELLYTAVMNIPCERTMSHFVTLAEFRAYKEGHHAARHAAVNLVAAFKSRAADALDSQPTVTVAEVRARVLDAVADNLRGLYYCNRVWSAWSVGTMGEDDFSPAEEDDDIIANITDAVMATLAPASSQPTDGGVRNGSGA